MRRERKALTLRGCSFLRACGRILLDPRERFINGWRQRTGRASRRVKLESERLNQEILCVWRSELLKERCELEEAQGLYKHMAMRLLCRVKSLTGHIRERLAHWRTEAVEALWLSQKRQQEGRFEEERERLVSAQVIAEEKNLTRGLEVEARTKALHLERKANERLELELEEAKEVEAFLVAKERLETLPLALDRVAVSWIGRRLLRTVYVWWGSLQAHKMEALIVGGFSLVQILLRYSSPHAAGALSAWKSRVRRFYDFQGRIFRLATQRHGVIHNPSLSAIRNWSQAASIERRGFTRAVWLLLTYETLQERHLKKLLVFSTWRRHIMNARLTRSRLKRCSELNSSARNKRALQNWRQATQEDAWAEELFHADEALTNIKHLQALKALRRALWRMRGEQRLRGIFAGLRQGLHAGTRFYYSGAIF